jgi:mono/diheme cytochrome c family protein
MSRIRNYPGSITLAVLLALQSAGCSPRTRGSEDVGRAPVDTATARADTTVASPDPSAATPPVTPAPSATPRDTPPAPAAKPSGQAAGQGQGPQVTPLEYEGWRQYSVNCARCHGQDVLPNPVAANLLISLGPGGPIDTEEKFIQVVSEGRPERGMPAFKSILTPDQMKANYAYVKARAEKRIPPGRPAKPA